MRLNEIIEPKEVKDRKGPIDYKIFVDLDGVLANFDKKVKELTGKLPDQLVKKDMWNAIKKYYKDGHQFYRELDLMPDANQLWNHIKVHDPIILTATGQKVESIKQEKVEWCKEHFPGVQMIGVVHSHEKANYIIRDTEEISILIDDREKSINPWVAAGGVGILHTSARQTIKELKGLGL